jgi:hypothetical protein
MLPHISSARAATVYVSQAVASKKTDCLETLFDNGDERGRD